MITRIYNINLITKNGIVPNSTIDIQNDKIVDVFNEQPPKYEEMLKYNGKGAYASAGFVDIHVHGGGGIEFMNASPDQIRAGCMAHAQYGTTTILPTSLTAPLDLTLNMINAVREAQAVTEECTIAGVHLEGPFISAFQCGAQSPEALKRPSQDIVSLLLNQWEGGVRIMGVAPELEGGIALGRLLNEKGITASIAHSNANFADCMQALDNGYTDITHIYSGCSMVRRKNGYRFGGVVEAGLLDERFTVQVIADGKHLPAELLRLIVKCKGADKIALITDALFAAASGFCEGDILTQANGMKAILEDGVMKLLDRQSFAGSVATMDKLVRNMVKLANVPLWDAITMATETPAKIAGLQSTKGLLAKGYDADIVLLDKELMVRAVICKGKMIRG